MVGAASSLLLVQEICGIVVVGYVRLLSDLEVLEVSGIAVGRDVRPLSELEV